MREIISAKEAIKIVEDYYGSIELIDVCENQEYFCIFEDAHGNDDDSYYFVNKETGEIETFTYDEVDGLQDVPEEEWK